MMVVKKMSGYFNNLITGLDELPWWHDGFSPYSGPYVRVLSVLNQEPSVLPLVGHMDSLSTK